jgi:small subunit ribosomal protein S2
MRRFILAERNGIHVHDLSKTVQQIRDAVVVIRDLVAKKKRILFVGTKKQAKAVVKECAESAGEFFISERWLGGSLTNLATIRQSVKTMERIEGQLKENLPKKELALLQKAYDKLFRNLSGVADMRKAPGLLIIVDPGKEHIAVAEANKLGIPVMALVDTNCDPDPIDYVIACNDDSHKSIKVVLDALTHAIVDKKAELYVSVDKGDQAGSEAESSDDSEE